jgi:hypothetical protein
MLKSLAAVVVADVVAGPLPKPTADAMKA